MKATIGIMLVGPRSKEILSNILSSRGVRLEFVNGLFQFWTQIFVLAGFGWSLPLSLPILDLTVFAAIFDGIAPGTRGEGFVAGTVFGFFTTPQTDVMTKGRPRLVSNLGQRDVGFQLDEGVNQIKHTGAIVILGGCHVATVLRTIA